MSAEHNRLKLIWSYLTQPLFGPGYKSLHPVRFWQLCKLEQLEVSWVNSPDPEVEVMDELLDFLDHCWQKNDGQNGGQIGGQIDRHCYAEFVQFLERCWAKSLSQSSGHFDRPHPWSDEEEHR